MQLRSNPHSNGAGYRLATAVGAATGSENAGFYGHLVPSGIPFADPADFVDLSLYYSEHALLFNLDGPSGSPTRPSATTSRRWRCWSSPSHAAC